MSQGKPEPRSGQRQISVGFAKAPFFQTGVERHTFYLAPRNADGVLTDNGLAIKSNSYVTIAHIRNKLRAIYGDQIDILHVQVTRNPISDPTKPSQG